MLNFLSYPNNEKALEYLLKRHFVLRQKANAGLMSICVLRDGYEFCLEFKPVPEGGVRYKLNPLLPAKSFEILQNNIGLVNPSAIMTADEVHNIMTILSDTNGLIIDMRQYPSSAILFPFSEYLLDQKYPHAFASIPFKCIPGVFFDALPIRESGPGSTVEFLPVINDMIPNSYSEDFSAYFYNKKIAVLVNGNTMSYGETMVMSLRNGLNVTIIGSNTIGANGSLAYLPLPGGMVMGFSSQAIFSPNGGQTQRIGIQPDIIVKRTVEGVRDGRDELLEAAINFILG